MTSTGTVHSPTTIQARAGIDCAIVANHQCELIEYRDDGTTRTTRKTIPSTAAGMNELTRFLAAVDVAVDVVAEPTSLTWVGIQAAVGAAGGRFYLIGTRHSSRLRAAVAGKNKSDVIDAHLLAKALDLFDLEPLVVADVGSEAIKRSALSRGDARVHYDQCWRRLRSYVAATVPDIDKILAGSRTRTLAVLGRWPDLRALARAHRSTIAAVLRQHSYCSGRQEQIADQLRSAAAAWVSILEDYYDLDFWRLKVAGMLADIDQAADRFDRYTEQLDGLWHAFYGPDDLLLSVPGTGPITAATIRGWLGDGSRFARPEDFASYCGLTPSNWSSGTMEHKHRAISKEGPSALRMAVFLAANAARTSDPQLARVYHRLMVDKGQHHNKAVCAVARKLAERIWIVVHRNAPYEYRDDDGAILDITQARAIVRERYQVPAEVRARHRNHTTAQRRARLAA